MFRLRNLFRQQYTTNAAVVQTQEVLPTTPPIDHPEHAFEKARFEYCLLVYEHVSQQQQQLEAKSQFYLSLVTLLLGVLFFNLNSMSQLGNLVKNRNISELGVYLIFGTIILLALALISAVMLILLANRLLLHTSFYPKAFSFALFSDDSEYLPQESMSILYRASARSLAIAIEDTQRNNDEKSKWLVGVNWVIVPAMLALTVLVGIFTYYSFL